MNVIEIFRSYEQEIKNRFAVRRIGLFGSFVRGEETKESDIDILVEFEDPRFRNFLNLAFSWRISLAEGLTYSLQKESAIESSPMWRKRWYGLIRDDRSVLLGHILDERTLLYRQ